MIEDMPPEVAAPIALVLIAVAFWQRRHWLGVKLGFKKEEE